MKFYDKEKDEVLKYFNTDEKGLTIAEAKDYLEKNGKNELPKKKQDSIFKLFISQFEKKKKF